MTAAPIEITEAKAAAEAMANLDEECVIPCENEEHDQPPVAEWIVHWACCDPATLVCGDCKDRLIDYAEPTVSCDNCGARYTPGRAAIRLIEPLSRRPT